MKKTVIYLDEATHRRLRIYAVELSTSMTELVRQAIAGLLERERRRPPRGRESSPKHARS